MTNDAPERIWAAECRATNSTMWWPDDEGGVGEEYIRADHAQAELQAAVAAAYEDAALEMEKHLPDLIEECGEKSIEVWSCRKHVSDIRARADTDAQAALEAVKREARNEALREAAAIIGVKVGHGFEAGNCQCWGCDARRSDHAEILALAGQGGE